MKPRSGDPGRFSDPLPSICVVETKSTDLGKSVELGCCRAARITGRQCDHSIGFKPPAVAKAADR